MCAFAGLISFQMEVPEHIPKMRLSEGKSTALMKVIILAGGSGTRLWPLSRTNFPKQFLKLKNNRSLFQMTVERSCRLAALPQIYVVIFMLWRLLSIVFWPVRSLIRYLFQDHRGPAG